MSSQLSSQPSSITVRLATLTDTIPITEIHKSQKYDSEKLSALGIDPVPYEELTLYERWRFGGPWMSVESCAVHLSRLLSGSGMPLVAEIDGKVLAEAEVYEGFEPAPFGHHLHLAEIMTHADYGHQGLASALLKYIVQMARLMKCQRITASQSEGKPFYTKQGFRKMHTGHGVRIPAQQGRAFYQAVTLTDHDPEQIKGWYMPFGRYSSARQEWEKLFPQQWAAGVPELLNAATQHLKLTVTGQNAVLFFRQADEPDSQPGEVTLGCWSARLPSNPLLTAIRDRAFRDGYHTIITYVPEADLPLLGNDCQPTAYTQDVYEYPL